MRSISRTLMILLIPIFIGCASKIKIDELSIEGDVFDEETNEGIEDVTVEIRGDYGWDCDPETDEDGEYYVDDSCLKLKNHLESMNLKDDVEIQFSISFDLSGYKPQEIPMLKWKLKDKIYRVPATYLIAVDTIPECPDGKYPCPEHPSRCCLDCVSGTFWQYKDGIEECIDGKIPPPPPPKITSKYLKIKFQAKQLDNISFGLDGKSIDETEEMELIDWDEERDLLSIRKIDFPRRLELYYTINGEDRAQTIGWDPEVTASKADLELNWNSIQKKYIANWETK